MKKIKLIWFMSVFFAFANLSHGQHWVGDNTTTSPIGRTGGVAIGLEALRGTSRILDVNGNAVIATNTTGDILDVGNSASGIQHNADVLWLAMEQPQDNNPGLFTISSVYPSTIVKNYNTKFKVRYNGNVGIGTDEPARDLDIKGFIQLYEGRNGDPSIFLNRSSHLNRFGANGGLGFWTNANIDVDDNAQMVLNTDGKLGIGTMSPQQKLDVNGYGNFANEVIAPDGFRVGSSTSDNVNDAPWYGMGASNISFGGPEGATVVQLAGYWGLNFQTAGVQMVMTNSGNVGIGIPSPTEKLSVNGNIRTKEVKVEATKWPDYVFQPQYKLSKLTEIEKYISENGHLPNIPSAKDVEKDGISLGNMNAKLLEKVEELTLLMIEQSKEFRQQTQVLEEKLEKQQKEIEEQKKDIKTLKPNQDNSK